MIFRRRQPPKIEVRVVPPPPDPDERRRSRRRDAVMIIGVIAGVVGAVAAVVAIWPHARDGASGAGARAASPNVSLEETVVHNGRPIYTTGDAAEPGGEQTLGSSPAIDFTLLNHGKERVLVTGVRVDIIDSADLRSCYNQGAGPVAVSARYTIRLPTLPLPSETTIRRALHQQIPPNDVDRFIIRFGLRDEDLEDEHLYALHVTLGLSGRRSIDVGRFVIALPGVLPPSVVKYPIDDRFASASQRDDWLGLVPTWCYLRNMAEAKRVLSQTGGRSQQLAALPPIEPAPGWLADHDSTPPRRAAEQLVDATFWQDVPLAVFAAEQTGDSAFIAKIRKAAAARLVVLGRKAIDDGLANIAVQAARASLASSGTPEGRDLLAQAERRLATHDGS